MYHQEQIITIKIIFHQKQVIIKIIFHQEQSQ